MASFEDFRPCPQCRFEQAFLFIDCDSGEETSHCPECGYAQWTTLVWDRAKEKAEGVRRPKLTKAGRWMHRRYVRAGHGVVCIKKRNGAGEITSLRTPPDLGLLAWFAGVLADPDVDPEHSYLNRWDREKVVCCRRCAIDENREALPLPVRFGSPRPFSLTHSVFSPSMLVPTQKIPLRCLYLYGRGDRCSPLTVSDPFLLGIIKSLPKRLRNKPGSLGTFRRFSEDLLMSFT